MSGSNSTMYTARERRKSNFKLAYYYNRFFFLRNNGYAKRLFFEEYDVNYQVPATKYLESHCPKLIGCTALHIAAEQNEISDVEFLLSCGADPTIRNQSGLTSLHLICESNRKWNDDFCVVKSTCRSLLSALVESEYFENPSDKNGFSHFHVACMADHVEAVEFFLRSGVFIDESVNANSPYFPGYAPLHLAASCAALEVTKVLLNSGANTKLKNSRGMTFLCTLLEIRTKIIQPFSNCRSTSADLNLEMMNFLLQKYWCPIDYKGLTHLHLACSSLELSIVKRLLQGITDINQAVDFDAAHWAGYTALHFAAYSSIEMVKMLVKNGANLLAKDAKGVTPLDMCTEKYRVEDVHAVMSLDSRFRSILMSDRKTRLLNLVFAMKDTKQFDYFLEPRSQIVKTCVPIDSPVWQSFTPLHLAVTFYDHHDRQDSRSDHIIRELMNNGADINAQDVRGRSPIHLAYRQPRGNHEEGAIKLLLEISDKIEQVIDQDNLSHLHIACGLRASLRTVVKILRTNVSVDVNVAFKGKSNVHDVCFGSTPLHCSARSFNELMNGLLLQCGANPMLKDANEKTPAHLSLGESPAILISTNLRDSVVADSGLSHLYIASSRGNVTAAEHLLDNGANINQQIRNFAALTVGFTPLDIAMENKDEKLVELLVRRGAEILSNDPSILTSSNRVPSFLLSLCYEDSLLERLEMEIGLTKLHLACCKRDRHMVEALLAAGADVNAQIDAKSRFGSGCTPLHLITNDWESDENLDEIVRLLLVNGADVTLSAMHQTPLHLAYDADQKLRKTASKKYSPLMMIFKAHRDYTVNPTRLDGLSHLHIACSIGHINAVENLLKHGADVNQHTEIYIMTSNRYSSNMNGCTPLHFAVVSSNNDVDATTQLRLVDVLLNYGADVDAKNTNGNAALHFMAELNADREDVIIRMIKSKADVNSRNSENQTPLEVFMKTNKHIDMEDIKCFLKFGCLFNAFNSVTGEGLIAIALTFISCEDMILLIQSLMINFPHLVQMDEMGCTVIHNIVSNKNKIIDGDLPDVDESKYVTLLEELGQIGLDVDHQDKLGRTPLHLAVQFRNNEAISALLLAGADVNVTDVSGKTAFSYIFEDCSRCTERKSDHCRYDHTKIFLEFMCHMNELLVCGLHVNQINEILVFKATEMHDLTDFMTPNSFKRQLDEIRNVKIAHSRVILENFLSETDAIVTYPNLPQAEREAVDKFFQDGIGNLRTKYDQLAGVLVLQYRKCVERVKLISPAQAALNILSKMRLPDLCAVEILKLLTNSELSSMIEATMLN